MKYVRNPMKKVCIMGLLFIAGLAALPAHARAGGEKHKKHKEIFFLVFFNGLDVSDFTRHDAPNLRRACEKGAAGLLNNRVYGRRSQESIYLTVNTSSFVSCDSTCRMGFSADEVTPLGEPVGKLFLRNSGVTPRPNNLLNFSPNRIINAYDESRRFIVPPHVGLLGDMLGAAGIDVYAFGNSDYRSFRSVNMMREITIVGMDRNGITKYGDVSGRMLMEDQTYPFGVRLNDEALFTRLSRIKRKPALVIIEFSDFQRADMNRDNMTPDVYEELLDRIFQRADKLLGRLMDQVDEKGGRLLIAVPRQSSVSKNEMGLAALYGPGIAPGEAASDTTHRPGIVTLIDITPTITDFFGLEKTEDMYGAPMASVSAAPYSFEDLARQNANISLVDSLARNAFFYFFGILSAVCFGLILLVRESDSQWRRWARFMIYVLSIMALLVNVPSLFPTVPFGIPFSAAAAASIFLAWILLRVFVKRELPVVLISGVTAIVLVLDLFTGARLGLNSIFGYSTNFGGRFFGYGNIQMAQLIGAIGALFVHAALTHKWTRTQLALAAVVLGIVCCVLFALPGLATNFGGALAAIAVFGFMCLFLMNVRFTPRNAALLGLVFAALGAAFVAASVLIPAVGNTHFGAFGARIYNADWNYIFSVITMKLKLNLITFRAAYWSLMFLSLVIFLPLVWSSNRDKIAGFLMEHPSLHPVCKAIFWGGIAGFAVNDSGLAVPCLIWFYPVSVLILAFRRKISTENH